MMLRSRKAATILAGGLAATVGIFFIVLFLIKLLWAWTIPDLFPGAVEEGLVAASVSWGTAAKMARFAAVLSMIPRS